MLTVNSVALAKAQIAAEEGSAEQNFTKRTQFGATTKSTAAN
jgi:hypothetical protein